MTTGLPVENLSYLIIKEDSVFTDACVDSKCFKIYGDGKMKCFTHDINFVQGEMYKILHILLTKTKHIIESKMMMYFHHPGQLFRVGNDPVFEGVCPKKANRVMFNVQSVTVLQRRTYGKEKCNPASFEEDKILFENKVKLYNCNTNYKGQ